MKHKLIFLLFGLIPYLTYSQKGYTEMTKEALHIMWEAKNNKGFQASLDLYEAAFKAFPDSIDHLGMYKASVLAGKLKYFDKAFQYLAVMEKMGIDEYGSPNWEYIAGDYSSSEYANLLEDPRWKKLEELAKAQKAEFFQNLKDAEQEFLAHKSLPDLSAYKGKGLYKKIRDFNPYLAKQDRDYSISFPVKDTLQTSYFIHLPADYNPQKSYPLLFFLHGAVRYNSFAEYQSKDILGGWNRYYTKYADREEVILVFLKGSKTHNWMLPDDGFFMIPEVLRQVKQSINVDPNKVFVSGHSNGATGSFSYLMKAPSQFAGFYGFNTYPKVFTGGTFIENAGMRSFINFSTDQDYYYPPKANDQMNELMQKLGVDYKDYRYEGFPHWFPEFDESEPAYQILFSDLKKRNRKPYPTSINWEFDDHQYGHIDWLTDIQLDTLSLKADWHKKLNFEIKEWLEYDKKDNLVSKEVNKKAFDIPRKSGKIKASFEDNVFSIQTSCIQAFKVLISPEMVDLNKKVKVILNGKTYFSKKIGYDDAFLLQNFEKNGDRAQLWVGFVEVGID